MFARTGRFEATQGLPVGMKSYLARLSKPTELIDQERLDAWCATAGCTRFDRIELRRPARLAGEVRSIRIVPRAGADALEATLSDGRSTVTAVFLGRRKINGISPGRRLFLEGVVTCDGGSRVIYNPLYELAA